MNRSMYCACFVALVFGLAVAGAVHAEGAGSQKSCTITLNEAGPANAESAAGEQPPLETRVMRLQHADGPALAKYVNKLFEEVRVIYYEPARAVMLRGPQDALEQCAEVIGQLDISTEPPAVPREDETVTEFVPLTHAPAEEAAKTIRGLFGESKRSRRGSSTKATLKVFVDQRLNTLIMKGPRQVVADAGAVLATLDVPSGPRGVAHQPVTGAGKK